jgi:hypothetical protein
MIVIITIITLIKWSAPVRLSSNSGVVSNGSTACICFCAITLHYSTNITYIALQLLIGMPCCVQDSTQNLFGTTDSQKRKNCSAKLTHSEIISATLRVILFYRLNIGLYSVNSVTAFRRRMIILSVVIFSFCSFQERGVNCSASNTVLN